MLHSNTANLCGEAAFSGLSSSATAGDVIEHQMQPGMATSLAELEGLLEQHKPLILFICHGAAFFVPQSAVVTAVQGALFSEVSSRVLFS